MEKQYCLTELHSLKITYNESKAVLVSSRLACLRGRAAGLRPAPQGDVPTRARRVEAFSFANPGRIRKVPTRRFR